MAKLSKSTRTIIIAAGLLLVLGVVCLVLLMTQPKEGEDKTSVSSSDVSSSETDSSVVLTDKAGSEVITAEIKNENGSFTFTRDKRVVSATDTEGNVTSSDEYFWVSEQMSGLSPNDTMLVSFTNCLAGLTASEIVEENAEELDKYGLATPLSTAKVTFEDNTTKVLQFGIRNPADNGFAYCKTGDSNTVYLVNYYTVANVYEPITSFVNLTFTSGYDMNNPQELDYLVIERKDLDERVEISFMYDVAEESENEDSVITTFNTHRMTSPFKAEIDSNVTQSICYGLYNLTATQCIAVEVNDELLSSTGLDDPFCRVTFKYGGQRYVLLLGDQIIVETATNDESTPTLTTIAGYYGMIEGSTGVYAFATGAAPWYSFKLQDIVSRRPLSPYIYTVDTLVITTPDREYVFDIEGDASSNTFTLDGQELNGDKFRQLYQQLISPVGDELFLSEGEYEPYIKVTFNYRDEYHEVYDADHDTLEFFKSDENDRKNIVAVNGKVIFKVVQVYTERMLSNIDALINGGDIVLNW